MRAADELLTERLRLRRWRPEDAPALAAINHDPEVSRYLNRPPPGPAMVRSLEIHWEAYGFGLWAVEMHEDGELLGFAGLSHPTFIPELSADVEIGWRLARSAWGRGFASEAARAARDHARDRLGLARLISVIHPANARSRRVAEKLGMSVGRHAHNPVLGIDVEVWELALGG